MSDAPGPGMVPNLGPDPSAEEVRVSIDVLLEHGEGRVPPSVVSLLRAIASAADSGGAHLEVTTYRWGERGIVRDVRDVRLNGVRVGMVSDVQIGIGHAELGSVTLQFIPGSVSVITEEYPYRSVNIQPILGASGTENAPVTDESRWACAFCGSDLGDNVDGVRVVGDLPWCGNCDTSYPPLGEDR